MYALWFISVVCSFRGEWFMNISAPVTKLFTCDYQHGHKKLVVLIQTPQGDRSVYKKDSFNTLRPWQNYSHFTVDIFKGISLNENVWITIEISLHVVSY